MMNLNARTILKTIGTVFTVGNMIFTLINSKSERELMENNVAEKVIKKMSKKEES